MTGSADHVDRQTGPAYESSDAMVELSIVIPTYNRESSLRRCLDALRGLTLPAPEFEVIVVVDGSTDGTAQLLAGYDASFRLRTPRRGRRPALRRPRHHDPYFPLVIAVRAVKA